MIKDHFLRNDTAKHYRKIHKLLHGNPPLDPEPVDHDQFFSFGISGLVVVCLVLIFIASCSHPKSAIAENIDLNAISFIESSDEPLAYNNGHYGEYQISEGVLHEYFEYALTGYMVTSTDQLYDEGTAAIVANWYLNTRIPTLLKIYDIPDNVTNRIICWNYGIGHFRHWYKNGHHWSTLPRETRNYIHKYYYRF